MSCQTRNALVSCTELAFCTTLGTLSRTDLTSGIEVSSRTLAASAVTTTPDTALDVLPTSRVAESLARSSPTTLSAAASLSSRARRTAPFVRSGSSPLARAAV